MSVIEATPIGGKIRSLISKFSRHTPMFRGKGRIVLLVDGWLTDTSTAESSTVMDTINNLAHFHFDLRPWGQKFAYYYGEWERDHINMIRRLYCGGTFVDVGSSLGIYVVCMGDLVAKAGASMLSVEPVPQNLVRQKRNVELNNYQDLVRYCQVGLGSEAGKLCIGFDETSGDNNAIIGKDGGFSIPVMTLDQLVQDSGCERVGLIKLDVEGYEPEVIEGAHETIVRHRPVVFAEFNRERMAINGFEITRSWSFFLDNEYKAFQLSGKELTLLQQPGDIENIYFLPQGFRIDG